MTYQEMLSKINTAGAWFTGSFLGEFIYRYPDYCDDQVERTKFINYIHKEYGQALEYSFDTTKTKCYAVMAIIKGHRVLDAIEHVLQSNDLKVVEGAKENAAALLEAINTGKVILP